MGIISLEHTDRLYWLGRYTERVYTTLRLYIERYDELIDGEPLAYRRFCAELDIPDIYLRRNILLIPWIPIRLSVI